MQNCVSITTIFLIFELELHSNSVDDSWWWENCLRPPEIPKSQSTISFILRVECIFVCLFVSFSSWVWKLFDYSYHIIVSYTHTCIHTHILCTCTHWEKENESFDSDVRLSCWFSCYNTRIFPKEFIYIYHQGTKRKKRILKWMHSYVRDEREWRGIADGVFKQPQQQHSSVASYCVLSPFAP